MKSEVEEENKVDRRPMQSHQELFVSSSDEEVLEGSQADSDALDF